MNRFNLFDSGLKMNKFNSQLILAVCFLGLSRLGLAQEQIGDVKGDSQEFVSPPYPIIITRFLNRKNSKWATPKNPTETNQVGTGEEEEQTFVIFRALDSPTGFLQPPPSTLPIPQEAGHRQKRETEAIPETTLIGKLRRKRSNCRRCDGYGGGGGGGHYPQPYYPGGGGGHGGGGHGGYGGGGRGGYGGGGYGGGGGFSQSSSSSKSSSGGFGFGK